MNQRRFKAYTSARAAMVYNSTMTNMRDIVLPSALKERLAQGHPWVYRNHVPPAVQLPSGSWVRARCGNWSGYGLWDAEGPIALRIFSERQMPDARWLRERVQAAWELRAPLRAAGCTAYRWLFGEGDGLPGITVDVYGAFAVVQTYSAGVATLRNWLINALLATTSLDGILVRQRDASDESAATIDTERSATTGEPSATQRRATVAWGAMPPRNLVVVEDGLQFRADLHVGQKTGLFLDHRENRRLLETLSAERTVLNCFAYTGAFSLYALRGGAAHVTSADIGKGLAEAAAANIALNELPATRHTFVTEDCFTLLNHYVEQGRTFDIVILDPPSFAKSRQNRHAALRAYARLNALALQCIAPDGLLATASCTSQVDPEAFRSMLATASTSANRRVQIIHEAGQPRDHPVPAHFPEGRYLKFIVGRVGDIA